MACILGATLALLISQATEPPPGLLSLQNHESVARRICELVAMFCEVCLGVLQRLEGHILRQNGELTLLHHNRVSALKVAAASGCRICHAIWSQLDVEQKAFLEASDEQFPIPEGCLVLPELERDDDEAWDIRGRLMVSCAVLATVWPAKMTLEEIDEGSILFCTMINPERKMPEMVHSHAYAMFVLQPTADMDEEGKVVTILL